MKKLEPRNVWRGCRGTDIDGDTATVVAMSAEHLCLQYQDESFAEFEIEGFFTPTDPPSALGLGDRVVLAGPDGNKYEGAVCGRKAFNGVSRWMIAWRHEDLGDCHGWFSGSGKHELNGVLQDVNYAWTILGILEPGEVQSPGFPVDVSERCLPRRCVAPSPIGCFIGRRTLIHDAETAFLSATDDCFDGTA